MLINKLPTSYTEINYKTYIKIIQAIPAEKPDEWTDDEYNSFITLTPLSILLDTPIIDLERLPATELIPMLQRIQFLNAPIQEAKTTLNLKTLDELTYDEFVSYQRLRLNQWYNMPSILNIIIKDLSPKQIDNLNISEVMQCFFTLNKLTRRRITSLKIFLAKQLIKQGLKMLMTIVKKWFKVR